MGIFSKKPQGGGFMDVIRCDEPSYLIWKWHPEGTELGNNQRENAIRTGSALRVKDGSAAVFFYKQDDGTEQDIIYGPYDGIIETKNFPVLARIIGLAYEGGTPFQSEVYFINLAEIVQIKFGVPYFDVFDPRFLDYAVPVAVRGTLTFMIKDITEFIKLHRLENFTIEDFKEQVKDAISKYVKAVVANAPNDNAIPVMQIERRILEINDAITDHVKPRLESEFGIFVSSMDIAAIDVDKDSEGYIELKKVTKDISTDKTLAATDVEIKDMKASQKLGVLERAGRIITDIKEDQYARHKRTQSENYPAYQTEAAENVGVEGAKGLGQMGSNTGGGSGGMGINPAAMMAGMAVGSAMGQNIVGTMNSAMSGVGQPLNTNTVQQTPPPIPKTVYNVVVNDESTGPYDIATLSQMALSGQLKRDSLVWKPGMENWEKMNTVDELESVVNSIPPEIPKT